MNICMKKRISTENICQCDCSSSIIRNNSPCNEKDLALLAVLRSHKIEVIDSITTIIFRERCSKIIIALCCTSSLFNHNLFFLLVNFKDHVTMNLLSLQFHIRAFAVLSNTHAWWCGCLKLNGTIKCLLKSRLYNTHKLVSSITVSVYVLQWQPTKKHIWVVILPW